MPRFRLEGEVYEFGTPEDVTLRDLLLVDVETRDLGWSVTLGEITRLASAFKGLSKKEAAEHPEGAHMLAVTIWLAKLRKLRNEGDFTTRVSFGEVLDFPLSRFQPLPDAEDRKPKAGGSGKAKRPKGSPQAVAPRT